MSYEEHNGVWLPAGTPEQDPKAYSLLEAINIAERLNGGEISAFGGSLTNPWRLDFFDGETSPGGFGTTIDYTVDYVELRRRSEQLFTDNLFAAGIVNKIVTATVATGLHLEAEPDEMALGVASGALATWSDEVESKFTLYANSALACDWYEQEIFGHLQYQVYREALIGGDCLVVAHVSPATGLPKLEVIKGADVQTPFPNKARAGHEVDHGVEKNARGKVVAYWVIQKDGTFKRVPAWGEKSGRRVAWLVTAVRRRAGEVRGRPLLQLVLQSLREIARSRTAIQRKMLATSLVAMFIERDVDSKTQTRPLTQAAQKRTAARTVQEFDRTEVDAIQKRLPLGMALEGLAPGETIKSVTGPNATVDMDFEKAVLDGIAIGLEIPPEVFRMQYGSNFAAAQMAKNDFKYVLNVSRNYFAEQLPRPVYREWLLGKVLRNQLFAPGLFQAFRAGVAGFEIVQAWTASEWSAPVHLSADLSRLATGLEKLIANGLMTRTRAAQEATGMSFRKLVRRLRTENEELASALAPLTPTTGEPTDE